MSDTTTPPAARVTVHSGPDNHGRYVYTMTWIDHHPAFCRVCGKDWSFDCGHTTPQARGQVFHAPLPVTAREKGE